MPVPYRASTFRQPVHQAPPLPPPPSTPAELEALMVAEMGPRLPGATYTPLPAVLPRSCRFHARVWSKAAVHRGAPGQDDGWVLLCTACAEALKGGSLRVIDTAGRYQGRIPAPVGAISTA